MTAVSRNVYFNLLDDIISKYNNTYHNSIKMNSIDVESNFYFEDNFDFNESDPIFQVGDHVKISKYRKMFGKWCKFLSLTKSKNTVLWTYVVNNVNGEEIIETFYGKELQKTNIKESWIEGYKLYVKWKGYNNSFNSWIDKKTLYKMSQYFPKPYNSFRGNINVKVAFLIMRLNITGIDTFKLASESDFASVITEIYELDAEKLKTTPVDLSKLGNVVNNKVAKKLCIIN